MRVQALLQRIGQIARRGGGTQETFQPVLTDAVRFPYGPFRFRIQLPARMPYRILASTDLSHWTPIAEGIAGAEYEEYIDSEAFKFSYRFYRAQARAVSSVNVIGYASVALPPGFSLIANPFDSGSNTVGHLITNWPDGTTLNKYDARLLRLTENELKDGKWTNPSEQLLQGEGAIFFNPTDDYRSHSFVGEVAQGEMTTPIPSGFSLRGSLVPKPGNLYEDLQFPISEGDVIHIFDRDRQKYVLYPFENGQWTAGAPILGIGESFWVAKAEPGNWIKHLLIESA